MIYKIKMDREMLLLRNRVGYILNVDSINKLITLHLTSCKYCNPIEQWGIQVESKEKNKTGNTWFSDSRIEVNSKVRQIRRMKGYQYSLCGICNP